MQLRSMLALASTALLLVGCSATPDDRVTDAQAGPVLWAHPGSLEQLYDLSVSWYNRDHTVPMTIQKYENDPYKVKLRESLIDGKTDTAPPDIFFNWGGGSLRSYLDVGKVQDLTPELTAHPEIKDKFFPNSLEAATYDGKEGYSQAIL